MPISPKPKITVLDTSTESVSNEPGFVDAGDKKQVKSKTQKTDSKKSKIQSPHPFFIKSKRPSKKKRKVETSSESSSDSGEDKDFVKTGSDESDLENEIPVKKIQLVTPNRSKVTPNEKSKKSTSKTPARTPKSSSSVTPSKKGKAGLIVKIETMFAELENLEIDDLNKNMLDYTNEILSKKKLPELQKIMEKLTKMKSSASKSSENTSKSVPSHRTLVGTKTHYGLNYFDKVHQTIKASGIRKLNGDTLEVFINSFTHKDKAEVRKILFKALYSYFSNKHERANWKRSQYLGDIDTDGCKWRAYSIILKIDDKLEPFMEGSRYDF